MKRQANVEYQHDRGSINLNRLREVRKAFQRTARKCDNKFSLKTSASIQAAANRGYSKSVHEGIKKAAGPTKKLISAFQSITEEILYDRDEQLGRWVQHIFFSLFFSLPL